MLNTTRAVEIVAFSADEGKGLGVRTISELAPWLMIAVGFVFFAAISAGCRFALSRWLRRNEVLSWKDTPTSCSVCLGQLSLS